MSAGRAVAAALALSALAPPGASAQIDDARPGAPERAGALAWNMLIGGATSAVQAYRGGRDPVKAFGLGALGGGVHFAGKTVVAGGGTLNGWGGLAVASIGTSLVVNAGSGASAFRELTFPLGAARVQLIPSGERKVALALNGFEAIVSLHYLMRRGLEEEWDRSLQSGTITFVTSDKRIVRGGIEYGGVAIAPVVIVNSFAEHQASVRSHELVHVQQQRFVHEAWGKPIERSLRERMRVARLIPAWLDLGLVAPAIGLLEWQLWGVHRGPLDRLAEAEANLLERR